MIWWRVVVEDGKVVGSSIVDASNARRRTGDPNRNHPTIDSLFESLAQAEATHPYMLSVVYDDALHYPRRAFVDPHGMVVDDEWTIEIRRLAPVGSSEIEIEKAEEKQRIQNEPPKLSSSQLMQIASDLERGGKRDEARKAYITAASRGSCEAAARLGDIYGQGGGGIRRDYAESLKWYNAARVLGCSVPTEKLR